MSKLVLYLRLVLLRLLSVYKLSVLMFSFLLVPQEEPSLVLREAQLDL
jgi:hypothetical protein